MSSAAVEESCLASEAFSGHTDTKTDYIKTSLGAKINVYCMLNTACKISDMLTDLTSLLLHKTWRSKVAISVGRCWPVLLLHFLLSGSRWHTDPVWSGCKNYPEVTLLNCAHRNKTDTKHHLEHCTWHTQVQLNRGSSHVTKYIQSLLLFEWMHYTSKCAELMSSIQFVIDLLSISWVAMHSSTTFWTSSLLYAEPNWM